MNCLVTGAAGFIGINLCEKLLHNGCNVTGIDNFITSTSDELMKICGNYDNFNFHEIDFSEENNESIYKNIDVIYHLGGMSGVRESILYPQIWFINNVVGTFKVLEGARDAGIKKVIIASSSASIGNADPPICEDMSMHPISPYGATKGVKELYASAYYHSYNIDAVALRFSNVYGPHSTIKTSLVAKFIRKILKGEEINIYGSGEQTRDFIYVYDLINAMISASKEDVGGEVLQISTCIETSVNEMTANICNIMKKQGFDIPKINYTDPAEGDIMINYADNTKAIQMLKWKPYIDIKNGLEETIRWFINEVTI